MFATLRCGTSTNGESIRLEHRHKPEAVRVPGTHHTACNSCRASKLRCNGDQKGCPRCVKKGLDCCYDSVTKEKKRKHAISGIEDSPSAMNKVARSVRESDVLESRPSDHIASQPLPNPGSSKEDDQPSLESWTEALLEGQDHDFSDVFDDVRVNMDPQIFDQDNFENTALLNPSSSWGHYSLSAPIGSPDSMKSRSTSQDDRIAEKQFSTRGSTQSTTSLLQSAHSPRNELFESSRPRAGLVQAQVGTPEKRAGCECLRRVLAVMEELEVHKQQAKHLSADTGFCFQRRALNECDSILECKICANDSQSVMLVILFCEKVVTFSQLWSPDGQRLIDDFGLRVPTSNTRVCFGSYETSSPQELTQILYALRSCFSQRLLSLLGRCKVLATNEGWPAQSTMAINLQHRLRDSNRE